jgi:hypothetical protein
LSQKKIQVLKRNIKINELTICFYVSFFLFYTYYFNVLRENINRIRTETANYIRFVKLLKTAAKKSIPRGHRHSYTPYWTKECDTLLNEYEKDGIEVNANRLIGLLREKQRKRWLEAMDKLDFIHSNRETWFLLRKLGAAQLSYTSCKVSPNDVSNILFNTSNIKPKKHEKTKIKYEYKTILNSCVEKSEIMEDFNVAEIEMALSLLKNSKAAGVDGVLPEYIKHIGQKGKIWLANIFSHVKNTTTLPKVWREAKVIAILKPSKTGNYPKNYRPISLLSFSMSCLKGSSWRGYK